MTINSYVFGRIVIDGKAYASDVLITPEKVIHPWWRESGHRLALRDIEGLLKTGLRILIVGTGSAGVMDVPGDIQKTIREQGIELFVEITGQAVQTYNRFADQTGVAAAFHLTC